MVDKVDPPKDTACAAPGFWEKIGQSIGLTEKTCNVAVEAMKPQANPTTEKLPNLLLDGVEGLKRQGRTGTINKQQAEMLKEI